MSSFYAEGDREVNPGFGSFTKFRWTKEVKKQKAEKLG